MGGCKWHFFNSIKSKNLNLWIIRVNYICSSIRILLKIYIPINFVKLFNNCSLYYRWWLLLGRLGAYLSEVHYWRALCSPQRFWELLGWLCYLPIFPTMKKSRARDHIVIYDFWLLSRFVDISPAPLWPWNVTVAGWTPDLFGKSWKNVFKYYAFDFWLKLTHTRYTPT